MDPNPDFVASLDQADATLTALAPVLGRYFANLCAQGFERAEAMDLVAELQEHWLGGNRDDPD